MELIPINANVHYKTAFDIHISNEEEISNLRRVIRSWCLEATKDTSNQDLHSAWYFRGDSEQHRIGSYLFRVSINVGEYSIENPQNWICEVIHPDRDNRNRKWSIEISFSRLDKALVRFAATVKNWINEGYIGEIPETPNLTTPKFVRELLRNNKITCRKGDEIVYKTPQLIKPGNAKELFERITSDNRYLPAIIISKKPNSKSYCINPYDLQKKILGNANVYRLEDSRVNQELNYYLGNSFSCSVGSLRVYMPRIRLDSEKDSYRHRFYSTKYIEEYSESGVINDITIGLSRNARTFTPREILTINDVISARRRHRISELLAAKNESSEQTEELNLLWEEVEDLTKKNSDSEALLEVYQTENEQLQQENSNLKWKANQADLLAEENTVLKEKAKTFNNMTSLPQSLEEVIDIIKSTNSNKIDFTERAIRSATEYKNEQEVYPEAWTILRSMCSTLHRLIFSDNAGDLEKQFKQETGFDLAMTEGRQTKRDSSLMKLRRDTYKGKDIDITPHIKLGTKEPKLLRVHFYPDQENKLIIVGHCGEHLDNHTSKSMK